MTRSLLDVNVLVALAWPSHVHHRPARAWFDARARAGWATCPFTQAGFIRVSSNPRIVTERVTPREAISLLEKMSRLGKHAFWPDELDFLGTSAIPVSLLMGHRQVTDAYLVGLALEHKGKLVTLDRSVIDLLPSGSADRRAVEVIPTE